MKKQKTVSKKISLFPILFVLCGLSQSCNFSNGSGGGVASNSSESPSCSSATSAQPSFFEEVDSATSDPKDEPEHALRNRHVKIDIEALKASLLSAQGPVRMDLFNDQALNVEVEKVQKVSDENLIMTGHEYGQSHNAVTLVVRDNVMVAHFNQEKTRFEIKYRGNGTHSIHQFAADSESADDCLTLEPPHPRSDEPIDSGMALASVPVIDMLVAYTPGARASVGGTTAMKALIQMGIADSNRAFQSSGVALAARLVGTMELRQNDTGNFDRDLTRLQRRDGFWDEIHAARAQVGADQVTVVGVYPNNNVNGIGYIKAAADSAFTVVKASAFGVYSFTHELGHNVGLNHTDGMESSGGRFRTIMAYGSYPRILRFSNPQLAYNNVWTGSSSHNSARILNSYANYTASLVTARVPMRSGDYVYTPPPTSQVCQ